MSIGANDFSALREVGLSRQLSEPQLRALLALAEPREWLKGHLIFTQNTKAEHLYVVLSGRVSLYAERSDGEQAVLDVVGTGIFFPLAPVVLKQNLSFGAQAISAVRVLSIPAATFLQHMHTDTFLAIAVTAELAREMLQMTEQNKALKLQNTNQRLARFLLQHTNLDDGAVEIRLQDERRLLARRLGMTPESLSRSIAQLNACGVEFLQQRVLIRDVDRLRQFCGLEIVT
jgi:CRP-like cAMP-binding protein